LPAGSADPAARLFVGQLPQEIAPATLSALFGHYGTVVECDVVRDSEMGVGKGFAFLTMGSSAEAATAMHSLNGYLVAGKRLQVAVKVRSFLFVARSKG
jgi:RNA recognition motif-containing protein